jgi:hypothetical protein
MEKLSLPHDWSIESGFSKRTSLLPTQGRRIARAALAGIEKHLHSLLQQKTKMFQLNLMVFIKTVKFG